MYNLRLVSPDSNPRTTMDPNSRVYLKFVEEALVDNETDQVIATSLMRTFNLMNNFPFTLNLDANVEFMMVFIKHSISNGRFFADRLQNRVKLMASYANPLLASTLNLLFEVVTYCVSMNVPAADVDNLLSVLYEAKLMNNFVRTHWLAARSEDGKTNLPTDRLVAIQRCFKFQSLDFFDPYESYGQEFYDF